MIYVNQKHLKAINLVQEEEEETGPSPRRRMTIQIFDFIWFEVRRTDLFDDDTRKKPRKKHGQHSIELENIAADLCGGREVLTVPESVFAYWQP